MPRRLVLNQHPDSLTIVEAAHRLTQMPKPLTVSVTNDGEYLHIRAAPLEEDSITKKIYDELQGSYATQGGAVAFLAKRHEGDISGLTVLCVAGHEIVRVTVRDVTDWQRDYWVERCGYAADVPDSPFVLGLGLSPADLSDVAAVIEFSSSGGTWQSSVDGVVDMRGTF